MNIEFILLLMWISLAALHAVLAMNVTIVKMAWWLVVYHLSNAGSQGGGI